MDQQSTTWHEWRARGLGSSDAPVIMGTSPWRSRLELWEEKTGLVKRDGESNWAQQRGTNLEPKARAWFEIHNDVDMPPACLEHREFPFLLASLDGWHAEKRHVLEIKCPGKDDHATALDGKVPEKYLWQLVHQMAVADAELAHYLSFDGEKGVVLTVNRDLSLEKQLIEAELAFWELVKSGKAPELSAQDYKQVTDGELVHLFAAYKEADAMEKMAAAKKDELKGLIKPLLPDHPRILCSDVRVVKSVRQGNIQYAKVPALKGVDLEQYRGKSSEVLTFTVVKDSA